MKNQYKIAVLANYPIQTNFPEINHIPGHVSPWLVAFHDAFEYISQYEIHWVTLVKGINHPYTLEHKNQFFHLIPRTKKTIGLYTFYLSDRRKIKKCIQTINPDLIHAWGTEDCYGLCAKESRCRRLLSIQGLLSAYKQRAKIPRYERHLAFYEPTVLRNIPFITTESPWAKERVLEITPKANVRLFEYAVEERFFNENRNLSESPSCLLACTNATVKNVHFAIESFSDKRLRHIKLYIAGVSKESYANVPENIILLGKVSRNEIVNLLSKTWCLIHTSLADTGPTIVKEARVMRVPAIITSDCGSKQYIQEGKSGYIFSPTDSEKLIQSILKVTESKEITLTMGLHDSERCRHELSQKTMIRNITKIYEEILTVDQ